MDPDRDGRTPATRGPGFGPPDPAVGVEHLQGLERTLAQQLIYAAGLCPKASDYILGNLKAAIEVRVQPEVCGFCGLRGSKHKKRCPALSRVPADGEER